jgi:hypothetical protein
VAALVQLHTPKPPPRPISGSYIAFCTYWARLVSNMGHRSPHLCVLGAHFLPLLRPYFSGGAAHGAARGSRTGGLAITTWPRAQLLLSCSTSDWAVNRSKATAFLLLLPPPPPGGVQWTYRKHPNQAHGARPERPGQRAFFLGIRIEEAPRGASGGAGTAALVQLHTPKPPPRPISGSYIAFYTYWARLVSNMGHRRSPHLRVLGAHFCHF